MRILEIKKVEVGPTYVTLYYIPYLEQVFTIVA